MRKSIVFLATIILFACALSSCNTKPETKEDYLKAYDKFITEIRENKASYSEEEWTKRDEEFKLFSEKYYEEFGDELGLLEQAQVAKFAITYGTARGTSSLNNVIRGVNVDKLIGEFKDLWTNDLKQDFDRTFNELEKTWNKELKHKLGAELGELKAILEDEKTVEGITDKIKRIEKIIDDEDIKGKSADVLKEMEKILNTIEREANKVK